MKSYDWFICGMGATGQVLAYLLTKNGYSVCFLSHKKLNSPLQLSYQRHEESVQQWHCDVIHSQEIPERLEITRLCLTTKSNVVDEALTPWLPFMCKNSRLYFWQNGIDFISEKTLRPECIYVVNIGIAAYRKQPLHVIHTGHSHVLAGSTMGHQSEAIANDIKELAAAKIDCRWEKNINYFRWKKVAINSIINPLSVIYNATNGELLRLPAARELMKKLSDECAAVFSASDINISAEEIIETSQQIMKKTDKNYSSMLQDFMSGLQTSEINFFNAKLIQLGDQHGIALPYHEKILREVQQCFKKNT